MYKYVDLRISDYFHNVADSLSFRAMKLSKGLNMIRLAEVGATYSDFSDQFVVSTAIVQQILKNRNHYEQIYSSMGDSKFITLGTKIKRII